MESVHVISPWTSESFFYHFSNNRRDFSLLYRTIQVKCIFLVLCPLCSLFNFHGCLAMFVLMDGLQVMALHNHFHRTKEGA